MPNQIQKNRLAAFNHQKGFCYYCKASMWLAKPETFADKHRITVRQAARFQCTAEHLVALQDGGENHRSNIVAACIFCNSKRHHRKAAPSPSTYRKMISQRLRGLKWHPQELHHVINAGV